MTAIERGCGKPFNPLLGETFEFENDEMMSFSEQVSHHPPVCASWCKGKKANWSIDYVQKSNSKFTGKTMEFTQQYRTYLNLDDFNERVEITMPTLSIHNLIIGTTYLDLGGESKIRILGDDELKVTLRYTRRGWLSKEEFKVEGEVVRQQNKDSTLLYKVHGNWNSKVYVTPFVNGKVDNSQSVVVFDKSPYPEKWDYMYGMSHFSIQLNYFPNWMEDQIAPTDTRRRPD